MNTFATLIYFWKQEGFFLYNSYFPKCLTILAYGRIIYPIVTLENVLFFTLLISLVTQSTLDVGQLLKYGGNNILISWLHTKISIFILIS